MSGMVAGPESNVPTLPDLTLYAFDACPFCARVRDALEALGLDALVKPCPRGGERFRAEAVAHGGQMQFPYLRDDAAGVGLYDSGAIVAHLYARAGAGTPPAPAPLPPFDPASLERPAPGRDARPSRAPERPLELWERRGAADARVRYALCELELPYVHRTRTADAPDAPAGLADGPVLVDPGTGETRRGTDAIVGYLEQRYGG